MNKGHNGQEPKPVTWMIGCLIKVSKKNYQFREALALSTFCSNKTVPYAPKHAPPLMLPSIQGLRHLFGHCFTLLPRNLKHLTTLFMFNEEGRFWHSAKLATIISNKYIIQTIYAKKKKCKWSTNFIASSSTNKKHSDTKHLKSPRVHMKKK